MAALGEFGRIERYLRPLAAGCPGALDLTDDAALLELPAGWELVVTTDAMVAGVHFLPDDAPGDIAAKLLRTNLSDLAAMGAEPVAYTLILSLPRELGDDWVAAFADGLAHDQARFGVSLAGGDSVATRGPATVAVTALGRVPRGTALTRRVAGGAISEQSVFVSGTIGDAALGLKIALHEARFEGGEALLARLRRPEPRLALGAALRGVATACADVSDGLVADLGHICEVTGCAARLEASRVPLSVPTRAALAARPELLTELLTGGDDYELVFTAPSTAGAEIAALAATCGVAVAEIGTLAPGPAGQVLVAGADGRPLTFGRRGWVHYPAQ